MSAFAAEFCRTARWLPFVTRLSLAFGLSGCFLLPPPQYPACNEAPSVEDVEAARSAHVAAEHFFFEKYDYQHALAVWMAAYHLDCTAHRLLINIARANEKLGDEKEALRALELYVERAGEQADPEVVEELAARKRAE